MVGMAGLMAEVDNHDKMYYCPLKVNRLVDDSQGVHPYIRVDQLQWSEEEKNMEN